MTRSTGHHFAKSRPDFAKSRPDSPKSRLHHMEKAHRNPMPGSQFISRVSSLVAALA